MSELYDSMAIVYDEMINWDARLKRELPFLEKKLIGPRILDLACSTGRHAKALSSKFQIMGIDINSAMLEIARKNTDPKKVSFICSDLANISADLGIFNSGYILANSLANIGSRDRIIFVLKKLRSLIPEGVLIGQTIFLTEQINYLPLRKVVRDGSDTIIQRIMFPVEGVEHTHELHFNVFNNEEYLSQSIIPLYSITPDELSEMAQLAGWELSEIYGGYNYEEPKYESGATHVWILR